MADIDHIAFAQAVIGSLQKKRLSYDGAVAKWPALNKATLSRACNGKALSAGNHLAVCRALRLNPYAFLIDERLTLKGLAAKHVADQSVTRGASRETAERAP